MSTIALLGNPNTGKTSLFNILTDSYEYVGNWSGVTVEKKVGSIKKQNSQLLICRVCMILLLFLQMKQW